MRYGAVIVAAGMSTRMKQFKQLMKIGDMSIAERVIVNFRRAGVDEIVMVTGYNAENLERALKDFGITFVRNNNYETTQMFDSARLGLEKIDGKCDRVFFCPVDVPFFTDQTVTEELELMDRDDNIDVIVPECRGKDGHPLLIRGSVIPEILAHGGERGMKGAYESLPAGSVVRIQVDDEGAVIDADTRDDYRKLVDLHNERILHPLIKVSFASTSPFFGPGTVSLLKEIDRCGNVREACEKCGFSYSKGWTILKSCEERFGYTIVERQAGGQAGGTARVTDKGHDLVNAYEELEKELEEIATERFRKLMKDYQLTGEGINEDIHGQARDA
ncbi:MAG: NTP transferase domain-containing protein [Mogibacterium sp.]|nr:NTP transferase domain-containing protein [Mogibacterium sp.]